MTVGRILGAVADHESLLILFAGPALIAPELVGPRYQLAAIGWVAFLTVARWAARGRISRMTPLDPPVVALAVMVPGAVAASVDSHAAWSRVGSLFFAVALFYAIANTITTPRSLWSAVSWLLLAGMGLSAVGLLTADWLDKMPSLAALGRAVPGLAVAVPHPTLAGGVHPNQLGGLLVLFVPLALACLLWPGKVRSRRRGSRTVEATMAHLRPPSSVRGLAVLSLALTVPTLLLTQSRGAWVGLAVSVSAMALLHIAADLGTPDRSRRSSAQVSRRRWSRVVGTVLVVGLTALVFAVPAASIAADHLPQPVLRSQSSGAGRLTLWPKVLAMLDAQPLTGVGLNSFPLVYDQRPEYEGHFVYAGIPHAHNTLLQAGVDYGLAGLTAVVGIYTALAWTGARAIRRLGTTPAAAAVAGLSFGLLAHATHGVVDAVAIGSKTGFVPWAFAGVLVGARLRSRRWLETPNSPAVGAGTLDAGSGAEETVTAGQGEEAEPTARANDRSSNARWTRAFATALGVWLATSTVAVALTLIGTPLAGVAAATVGGGAFGVLSATRVDSWKQRAGRKRPKDKGYPYAAVT